jgi:hypothetical protein
MTRFITSPDRPTDLQNAILLVDFSADEIAEAAYACKTCEKDFDVFLFSPVDKDRDWLDWAFAQSQACVVNLNVATNMLMKAQFLSNKKTFGIGVLEIVPRKKLTALPEYFRQQDDDRKK